MGALQLKINRFRAIASLDFHVLVTLLFRGWGILAGAATVFLLPLWISPTEQGYYFTFGSVLGKLCITHPAVCLI